MTGAMAETLSTIGLVAGFPLLLLCFMLSLEKLESWGLRDLEPEPGPEQEQQSKIDAAVEQVEQLAAAQHLSETKIIDEDRAVGAQRAVGRSQRGSH